MMKTELLVGLLCAALGASICAQTSTSPELPNDLQLILPAALPADAVYFSLRHWKHCPPAPFNWCAGLNAVSYYFSPSLGANRILIDDSALDTSA